MPGAYSLLPTPYYLLWLFTGDAAEHVYLRLLCLLITHYGYSRLITTSMLAHHLLWLVTGDAAEGGGVGRLGGEDARLEVVSSK